LGGEKEETKSSGFERRTRRASRATDKRKRKQGFPKRRTEKKEQKKEAKRPARCLGYDTPGVGRGSHRWSASGAKTKKEFLVWRRRAIKDGIHEPPVEGAIGFWEGKERRRNGMKLVVWNELGGKNETKKE